MDLVLRRSSFTEKGVFGILLTATGDTVGYTLEHSYPDGALWVPKVPAGIYTCERGQHALTNGIPFQTFMVTGVPGHQGILIHCGNFEVDSHGCILLGTSIQGDEVVHSRDDFKAFMDLQAGLDTFQLTIK